MIAERRVFRGTPEAYTIPPETSLARPGGTATGLTNIHTELTAKRLSLLKEAISGVQKVGVLRPLANSDAANTETRAILKQYDDAAKPLGLKLHIEDVKGPETFD